MVNVLTASATGTVSCDMREDGTITGVQICAAGGGKCEVSFNSTSNFLVNDVTGVLGSSMSMAATAQNGFITCNEPVQAGERIFMHNDGGGSYFRALIYSTPGPTPTSRAAVRRR